MNSVGKRMNDLQMHALKPHAIEQRSDLHDILGFNRDCDLVRNISRSNYAFTQYNF